VENARDTKTPTKTVRSWIPARRHRSPFAPRGPYPEIDSKRGTTSSQAQPIIFLGLALAFVPGTLSIIALPQMNSSSRSLSSATTEEGNYTKNTHGDDVQRGQTVSVENGIDAPYLGTAVSDPGNDYNSSSSPSKLSQYLFTELNPRRADIILIICGFVGGLVDGLSFNAWGSFSSMQTGMFYCNLTIL
jgi:hypothetical protein